MTYTETVKISKDEFDRITRLLSIESLEEMSDEEMERVGAEVDYWENIFYVKFKDGSSLSWDLGSGGHNYYDDVVWHSNDDSRNDVFPDCTYELSDIELYIGDDTYIVKIELEK